mmetsp:Transcript_45196/g.79568  ORF Transcript_45196/g.79568 Transcript_45196/m.79568 type:complete len:524 (-) Transcript_45196:236-1807(-)
MAVSRATLATLVSLLAWRVTAHSCDNGARVTCTEVQSTAGAPSTYGESFDAQGSVLCTPSGEKIFCLVNHDYHKCKEGAVPCCTDGSNPRHHGRDAGTSSAQNVTCTPKGVSNMVSNQPGAAPARPSPENGGVQVILDDEGEANTMENAHAGSYQPCMKDAYQGQFHHDWAKNKGTAHLSYHFDPPQDGCYLVEEYHPGSDETCARYLPSNTRMELDYCRGLSRSFFIDQGRNGAQWNPVGKAPFFKGFKGTITMRNANGEQCRSPPCFWVADAFRLTRVEDSCTTDGKLKMHVRLSNSNTVDDVLKKLEQSKDVLENAFADYFGYGAAQLVKFINTGRRLAEGELSAVTATVMVFGTPKMTTVGDLGQALQKALSDAGAGVQIESAEMDWTSEPIGSFPSSRKRRPSDDDDDDKRLLTIILVSVGIAAVLVFFIVCGFMLRSKAKLPAENKTQKCTVCPQVQDLEGAVVKGDKVKDEKDGSWEMESVSTATPDSEPTADEPSVCVAPKNSLSDSNASSDIII